MAAQAEREVRMQREREEEKKAQADMQRQLAALQNRVAHDDDDSSAAVGAGDQQQMLQTRQAAAAASANAGRRGTQQNQLADRLEDLAIAHTEGYTQHHTKIEELEANQRRLERELEASKKKKK